MKKLLHNLQPNSSALVKLFPVTLLPNVAPPIEALLGTDGQGDLKLICGIRIAGMNRRTKKEDKLVWLDDEIETEINAVYLGEF